MEILYCKAIVQATRKKLTKRVGQKKRVITVRNMRTKVIKRVETKVEKVRKALEQAEVAELKKKKTKVAAHKK